MTSKERVLQTIEHKEPDRVPVGEWGIDHDHVEHILGRHSYWRNRKDTTLALWENRRDEVVEGLKRDCIDIVEALDYDVVTVELVPSKTHHISDPPKLVSEGVWKNRAGDIYKYAASNDSISHMQSDRKMKDALTQEDIDKAYEKLNSMDDSVFELIDYAVEKMGDKRAILCRDIDIYSTLMNAFEGDYSHNLILTLMAPEEIQKLYTYCLDYNRRIIEHCAKRGVSILMQGQDFGSNLGCIISPESIRDIYMPVIKMVNDEIVKAGAHPFFHCCGKIWDILDDFVENGYVGYQSIQESAGMDTAKVKEQYGDRLTLWTGIQCETLVSGSIEETEAEVRKNLEICMPGGGFIFGSTNSVQFGAKTENYLKALETVRKYGVY